ncbi:nitrite/sulfite reductase [Fodinicurvata sp. EGI_FJ10296]|uniref:nitrite/sulfite reductase n=1 Tax=Fodinicurvata sp. EGI_FJ10296 TaxID=3231908 RepID=UPI003452907E
MYQYDEHDQALVSARVDQFRDQVARRLSGELTEDEFKPLRLMNGVYLQLHAYMLRIAIPYGTLSSDQMRVLAHVARTYDRGYGHFTTRQNIQFNWIALKDLPDAMADLAAAQMHGIQTSGNCIRNVTTDAFAGVAPDEIADPRIWAEILRQWSSLHPEFSFLPRKFKIALTGSPNDRAAVQVHDIGLRMRRRDGKADGDVGFEVLVGGGLGRTPFLGKTIAEFVEPSDLLSYVEAILRVYNAHGRRDNIYKARIKILVHDLGIDAFRREVDAVFETIRGGALTLTDDMISAVAERFTEHAYESLDGDDPALAGALMEPAFARWHRASVSPHRKPGYAAVTVSLKPEDGAPGDATAAQIEALADLSDRFGFGELRITHQQNVVLPHVRQRDLPALYAALAESGLSTANVGHLTDIIACPGLDFCSLANTRSIPIAQAITRRFADIDRVHGIGPVRINISGCINACGHHHVGHIGLLGVEKQGQEVYQITLGGRSDDDATLGQLLGPAVPADRVVDVVEDLIDTYLAHRHGPEERFIDLVGRLGIEPFKEQANAAA